MTEKQRNSEMRVFSAHAEVVPSIKACPGLPISILRARGGSSSILGYSIGLISVFSAHAEVVPRDLPAVIGCGRILRARGGSSHGVGHGLRTCKYSPRTRR